MTEQRDASVVESLHELLAGYQGFGEILQGVVDISTGVVGRCAGSRVESALFVRRSRRKTSIVGSSADALVLEKATEVEDCPGAEALRTGRPAVLCDVSSDTRGRSSARACSS